MKDKERSDWSEGAVDWQQRRAREAPTGRERSWTKVMAGKFGHKSAVPRSISDLDTGATTSRTSKLSCYKTSRLIWDNCIALGIEPETPSTPSIPVGRHDRLDVRLNRRRRGLSTQSKLHQHRTASEPHHNEEFSHAKDCCFRDRCLTGLL